MTTYKKGLWGERRALLYLLLHGYRIVARRFRTVHGEIDLIARRKKELVFVEVKYRPHGAPGEGFAAITPEKQKHLRFAAACYLRNHPADKIRFDAIEISRKGLRHLKNAL